MNSAPSIVDLFCGCGGFGLGAELAGFKTVAAIDIEPNLQSSYRLNFPNTKVVEGDISQIDNDCWRDIIGSNRPDGVIGGPPCQGFSRMGKRDQSDKRNQLIYEFYRQVNILRPKFFVMENVEGIFDPYGAEILSSALKTLKAPYKILGPFLVDAADFGAATRRRRAIVIGYLPDEIATLNQDLFTHPYSSDRTTIKDAISDLPGPIETGKLSEQFGLARLSAGGAELSSYARRARSLPKNGMGWNKAIEWMQDGRVTGFFSTQHTPVVRQRFENVEPGKVDSISKYPRLKWDGISPTLRAGTGSDRGSFQAVRPIHPDDPRVITVREAARIQGFPDWFVFHPTKWHSFRMIGNSVSPVVSTHILSKILSAMSLKIAA
ncbi:DNA cytosine methyltransferase [Roseovarius sp. EL26]|uniref:DNA cytosine methyltransferase n=1 Tax=Roseovarius sp. EL26 TaxID=2126672 RepID=UPI000EA1D422|nr:DNA cytosine methyltransferase [Roseovarius sp. EL26]